MKKLLYIYFFFPLFSFSQYFYCEDFDGYSSGDPIAETSSDWNTFGELYWGSTPPFSDDALVSNLYSNSGSFSLGLNSNPFVYGPESVLLPFYNTGHSTPISDGIITFTHNLYITSGAYFNFQAENIPGVWALDVNFDAFGGVTYTSSGGIQSYLTSTFPLNQWFEHKIIIDLSSNNWEVFHDGISQGSFSSLVNQIASVNYYPLAGQEFFVDDVCIEISPQTNVIIDSIVVINPISCTGNLADIQVYVDNDTSSIFGTQSLMPYDFIAFRDNGFGIVSYFSTSSILSSFTVSNAMTSGFYYFLAVNPYLFNNTFPIYGFFTYSNFFNNVLTDSSVYDFDTLTILDPIFGCIDSLACNYNSLATCDDLSCFINYGCTDSLATNYDSLACVDDGSCIFPFGCTDSLALNYDSLATVDDGSCQYSIYGCTDSLALNYSVYAIIDDGSCTYTYGCTDSLALNFDSLAILDDGSCLYIVYGCTDTLALNYNPLATNDDGSCIYYQNLPKTYIPDDAFEDFIESNLPPGGYNIADDDSVITSSIDTITELNYNYWVGWILGNTRINDLTGIEDFTLLQNIEITSSDLLSIDLSNNLLLDSIKIYGNALLSNINTSNLFNLKVLNCYVNALTSLDLTDNIQLEKLNCISNQLTDLEVKHITNLDWLYISTNPISIIDISHNTNLTQFVCINTDIVCIDITQNTALTELSCNNNMYLNHLNTRNGNPYILDVYAHNNNLSCIEVDNIGYSQNNWLYDSFTTLDTNCNYTNQCNLNGCMDPLALNYDSLATIDDGSCTYSSNCTSPKPTGLYAYDVIDNRAKIGWDNMNDPNCMVWKYFVRYREVGTNSWTTKSAGIGNGLCNFGLNTVTKQLLNLSPSTTYEFKMKAFYCGGTSSNYSSPVQFTTVDVCPDMINLTPTTFNGNQSKVRFNWDTTGAYVFARILLRVDTLGANWQTAGGFGVYFPTFFVNKFGLQSGQSYRAQGRAFCDSNITAYRSPTWTAPIFWTQPGSIRLNGGSSINNLEIFPNPSRDVFNISFTSDEIQDLGIRILNVVGAEVYKEDKQEFIGEYTKQVSLDNYGKGIYFLEIETNSGIVNKKLILQ